MDPDDERDIEALEIDLETAHIGEVLTKHGVCPTAELVIELWEYMEGLRNDA